MLHQMNSILADDEIAVAFADGGGQTCGRDSGPGNTGGGRGCDRPSPNPQDGCRVIGAIGRVPVVGRYTGARTGAALCEAGSNAIRAGNARTENAINQATGGGAKNKVARVTTIPKSMPCWDR